MGRDLYYTIIPFFEKRMAEHSEVLSIQRIDSPTEQDDYVYLIKRKRLDDVIVHLSDAYCYSEIDYLRKPHQLENGGFVCLIKPHACDYFNKHKINDNWIVIGKISILLGALHKNNIWEYEPPKRDE